MILIRCHNNGFRGGYLSKIASRAGYISTIQIAAGQPVPACA
jgi:hypothetical protein